MRKGERRRDRQTQKRREADYIQTEEETDKRRYKKRQKHRERQGATDRMREWGKQREVYFLNSS